MESHDFANAAHKRRIKRKSKQKCFASITARESQKMPRVGIYRQTEPKLKKLGSHEY